jgi:hypothetical protein
MPKGSSVSAPTAAAKAKYREYRRRKMMEGKEPKSFESWYTEEYGRSEKDRRKKHLEDVLELLNKGSEKK